MTGVGLAGLALGAAVLALALPQLCLGQVVRAAPGQPETATVFDLTSAPARLTVVTPAFLNGGDIPFENTE